MKGSKIITFLIGIVWLINGLFCKVLNRVPRHRLIVARILGDEYSKPTTIFIGLAEVVMTVWIISGFKQRLNAIVQMIVIATMNFLEYILAPDLLLWGKFNALFAFLFIAIIWINEFKLNKNHND